MDLCFFVVVVFYGKQVPAAAEKKTLMRVKQNSKVAGLETKTMS